MSACLPALVTACTVGAHLHGLRRGWLSRLEKVSSDKEEFCRLDRLLISVAVEGGNQPGPEQVGYLST